MTHAALVIAALAPLAIGIVLQLLLGRVLSRRAKGILALLCSALALVAIAMLLPAVRGGAAVEVRLARWDGSSRGGPGASWR